MTTTAKMILGFSLGCILFSFTDVGSHVYYGIIRPIGAVAFIVFYLVNMFGKEMKKFDQDHSELGAPKQDRTASSSARAASPAIVSH